MRNQCHIQNCQKKDHKDCKKECKKPCKIERYDSWSESSDSCNKPKGYRRCYKVCEYKFKQEKCEDKRWGHKIKEEGSWESVCDAKPRLHSTCGKNNHGRKH